MKVIISRNPSNLDIPFPIKNMIAKMIIVIRCNGSCCFTVSFLTFICFTNAAIPIINMVLTIVLPITFAKTILPLPLTIP